MSSEKRMIGEETKGDLLRSVFAVKLSRIHMEAMELGLIRTGHKLHDAVREVGWEIADIINCIQSVPRGMPR